MRRIIAVLATTALMVAMMAMPAAAQRTGLVNVDIGNVTVEVPVAAAVNLCPAIDVDIISAAAGTTQVLDCDARARSQA